MFDSVGTLAFGFLLLIPCIAPCIALTAGALWLAARLAPWFLQQRFEPPTVRSFFFDFVAESELDRARMTTMALAAAIVLAVLTPLICLIRFGGLGA